MTQLLELRAVVEAPPDAVAGVVLDAQPGGRSPFAADDDGSDLTIEVNHAAREVIQQSEWWFRATTTVEPDPRGSQVVHRIFNVAEGNAWAIRFLARAPLNAAPHHFAEAIHRLGEQLGAAAWVLD
jgi:hypothetical protein